MSTVGVFLCEILSNGPRSAQEVRQVVEAAGFSWWTARRVPDIEKARAGFGPGSAVVWKLANGTFVHTEHEECDRGSPPHTEQPVSRVATPETAIPEATRTPFGIEAQYQRNVAAQVPFEQTNLAARYPVPSRVDSRGRPRTDPIDEATENGDAPLRATDKADDDDA